MLFRINPQIRKNMTHQKILAAILLASIHTLVWAGTDNPHAPKAELSGTVVATEDVDNYTYVQIETEGEQVWYAVPSHAFTLGEEVIVPQGGLPMKDFYSETLDRKFDIVYFVGAIKQSGSNEETLPAGHPPIGGVQPADPESFDYSGIERPADGKTIEEIYAQKDKLGGETVVLRGIAVKVNNNILGKNWIHLRDGSGGEGSDDLMLTTTNLVEVGETITVSGTVRLDQDFGSGYRYDVLLEVNDILSK